MPTYIDTQPRPDFRKDKSYATTEATQKKTQNPYDTVPQSLSTTP